MITPEELDYIRTAAIGDMLGDRGSDRFCRGRGFYIGREKPCVTHGCAENFTGIFSARFCIV